MEGIRNFRRRFGIVLGDKWNWDWNLVCLGWVASGVVSTRGGRSIQGLATRQIRLHSRHVK